MTYPVILVTATVAAVLVFLIARQIARLANVTIVVIATIALALYALVLMQRPDHWILVNFAVLGAAGIAGSALGLFASSRVALTTFCVVASAVDAYSATRGATASLVDSYREGSSDLLRFLAVSMPVDGTLKPILGIGDFVIIGTICFALLRLGYPQPRLLLAPISGFLVAVIIGLTVGGIFAIPFIAATTIVYIYVNPATGNQNRANS